MTNTHSMPTADKRSYGSLWLGALWVVLLPAIIYCYQHVDKPLALWLHARDSRHWPVLNQPHRIADLLVYLLLPALIVCSVAWWRRYEGRWLQITFDACLSLAAVLIVKTPVKALFGRTWPDSFYHNNPSYLDHGVYGFLPLQWKVAYWAFPSGHTAQIVAVSAAVMLHEPKLGWIFVPLSTFVMIDLVAMNYHWLSDVLAGVLLGASIAFVVKRLVMMGQLDQWRARHASI
jgi:membrane-associated phospholipid phosphatase